MIGRAVKQILPATTRHWVGDGFHVHPVFADKAFTQELSPFLMFDYAAPAEFPPLAPGRRPRGVGRHPHRGFETVTIAFRGEVEHADSEGNRDVIRPGDVQWMTAGRGIVHQEFHSDEFSRRGGEFEMCQLWVNLPREHKMTTPAYQPILDKDIPSVDIFKSADGDGECPDAPVGRARVIAGSLMGAEGPASTFSPVELWDVDVAGGSATVDLPFPGKYSCVVFVRRGEIDIVGRDDARSRVGPQSAALMERDGDAVRVRSRGEGGAAILIMGGLPLDEPIAARGPFVMNTWDEIVRANRDYRSGRFI